MVGVRKAGVIYGKILCGNERSQKEYDVFTGKKDQNQKKQDRWG